MPPTNLINGKLLPLFYVFDVVRSVSFYRDKLGFEFKGWWDDESHEYVSDLPANAPVFAELKAGDVILHLHLIEEGISIQSGSTVFHLEVADVDQYHREVVSRGLSADTPQEMPWGWRQFYVTDPDGHPWSFRNPTTAGMA